MNFHISSKYLRNKKGKNRNFLHQQFHTDRPNQVWVSDITVFKFSDKYYYLCAIIDLFSRKIISYRISQSSSTQLLTKTFRQAYSERKPETGLMFHSDRGTQYISYTLVRLLETLGVKQSLSRIGRPHDNAVSEAFFSILKKEELYRRHYKSEIDMIQGIHRLNFGLCSVTKLFITKSARILHYNIRLQCRKSSNTEIKRKNPH